MAKRNDYNTSGTFMPSRRGFIKGSAVAMFGAGSAPLWMQRAALAATPRRKVLVAVFLRGAVDALNVLVPYADAEYARLRPNLALPAPGRAAAGESVLDLDGHFGLHPSLAPLKPLWEAKELAAVAAVGSPDPTRSHFDAQDYMEAGTPGIKSTRDGWLNRALVDADGHPLSPVRAVAIGSALPRSLAGDAPAVAIDRLDNFQVRQRQAESAFASLYGSAADDLLQDAGKEAFEAVALLRRVAANPPNRNAQYPGSRLAQNLRQIAALIHADVGLEVAFADMGGWDHHVNEVGPRPHIGQLANQLRQLAEALASFRQDLGKRAEDVVLVTLSEFGRTARENGTRGTDHGHGGLMLVLGGPIRGGQVYGQWPGLGAGALHEGRDLAVTTDFRTVLSELVYHHQNNRDLAGLFPGFTQGPDKFCRLYRS